MTTRPRIAYKYTTHNLSWPAPPLTPEEETAERKATADEPGKKDRVAEWEHVAVHVNQDVDKPPHTESQTGVRGTCTRQSRTHIIHACFTRS